MDNWDKTSFLDWVDTPTAIINTFDAVIKDMLDILKEYQKNGGTI